MYGKDVVNCESVASMWHSAVIKVMKTNPGNARKSKFRKMMHTVIYSASSLINYMQMRPKRSRYIKGGKIDEWCHERFRGDQLLTFQVLFESAISRRKVIEYTKATVYPLCRRYYTVIAKAKIDLWLPLKVACEKWYIWSRSFSISEHECVLKISIKKT